MQKQQSKLTLYIFVALVLGVIAGYLYNVYAVKAINDQIGLAGDSVKSINKSLVRIKDTTAVEYKTLMAQREAQTHLRKSNEDLREHKLGVFAALSDIFLRLIKMIIVPLVFTTLAVGVAKVGDIKAVGRIGGRTLLWFLGASLVSLLLGMLFVDLFGPGRAMHFSLPDGHLTTGLKKTALSVQDFINHLIPHTFVGALADNEILQVVVLAVVFGIATASIGERGEKVIKLLDVIAHVMLRITGFVMLLAPLAVFGAITVIVAKQGLGILSGYAIFIGEFYFSLLMLWLLIILAGYIVLKKRVFNLVSGIKDAILVAFGTSTSEAAYPKLMLELERFGCSNKIVSFVLPLGYSFNLDGGMMYMTFASLFIAQAYGVHLSLLQQLAMLLTLMFTSKGVAGVPRAALVVVAATLPMFNVPEAGLMLIIGIDPLLDMGRSATNVLGNAVAAAAVNSWEKENEEIAPDLRILEPKENF
jgi:Na+/H+-dicarboxylate symporter